MSAHDQRSFDTRPGDRRGPLFWGEQVRLGQHAHARLPGQGCTVLPELALDEGNVGSGVVRGDVDEHREQPRALDVTEELETEALAFVRALDQAGNVGRHELAL